MPTETPLDAPTLLLRLIEWGDRVLSRNARLDEDFHLLAAEIKAGREALSGIGDEATMLITCLRHVEGAEALSWHMIGGALMPMVRAAAWREMDERRKARATSDPEAQPDYRRGGRDR
jgi:hypothetical protein